MHACSIAQLFLTLCDPMDCSPSGSFVLEFSRQEHWSVLPFPTPGTYYIFANLHESGETVLLTFSEMIKPSDFWNFTCMGALANGKASLLSSTCYSQVAVSIFYKKSKACEEPKRLRAVTRSMALAPAIYTRGACVP